MKLMICTNLGVGSLPAIDLPSAQIAQWQEDRVKALSASLSDAKGRGAVACLVAGGLFAVDFVAQSLVVSTMKVMDCCGIPVYYVPNPGELSGVGNRMPKTESVHIIMPDAYGNAVIDVEGSGVQIPIITSSGLEAIEDVARPSAAVSIVRGADDTGASLNDGSEFVRMGPLVTSSFGERLGSGYLLADVNANRSSAQWVEVAIHPFVVRRVAIDRPKSTRELVSTVGEAVKDVDRASCLRVELTGRMPLTVYINTDNLSEQLGRYFFYVEVADECALDIDIDELDSDVSLLAEFVRKVSGDDSLSMAEKTRILRCGWNALNGKGLAE